MTDITPRILSFSDFKSSSATPSVSLLGGKGASLAKLACHKILGVPEAFFVTTEAFREILFDNEEKLLKSIKESMKLLVEEEDGQKPKFKMEDPKLIASVAAEIRTKIQKHPFSPQLEYDIECVYRKFQQIEGEKISFAVRSSGIGEDSEEHSFAGQYDTYLNVRTLEELYAAISSCFASLFTERALSYRMNNGMMNGLLRPAGYREDNSWIPLICVVCQLMIQSAASGVMFTADPLNSNRRIMSIDCSYGLGEAIVSGIVCPDQYKVKRCKKNVKNIADLKEISNSLKIASKRIGKKEKKVVSIKDPQKKNPNTPENTEIQDITDERLINQQVLEDYQIIELAALGFYIEKKIYHSNPQDIEYALDKTGKFHILQSRSITTLFPMPTPVPRNLFQSIKESEEKETQNDENDENDWLRVYYSFGHVQVMTQGARLFGLSAMEKACDKAFTRIDSHVDKDKRFLDAGGHWFFDCSDFLGIGSTKFKALVGKKGGHKGDLAIGALVNDPELLNRIQPSSYSVIFSMLGMYSDLGMLSKQSFLGFIKTDVKDLQNYHNKLNAILQNAIEKKLRKCFDKPAEKTPKIDTKTAEKLKSQFENGALYDPVFGNVLDLYKHLEERIPKKVYKPVFFKEVVENLIKEIKEGMFEALTASIPPILASFVYGVALEQIFEEKTTPDCSKSTKDLIGDLLTGLHGNITTEMDLTIADLADLVKKYPEVNKFLKNELKNAKFDENEDEFVLDPKKLINSLKTDEKVATAGGAVVADALLAFVQAFGFRGPCEIDVCNSRYAENIYLMIQAISGGNDEKTEENAEKPQEEISRRQHFEKLKEQGDLAGEELKKRVKKMSNLKNWCFTLGFGNWGMDKIADVAISSIRHALGKRESPKFYIIKLLWEVKMQIRLIGDYLASEGVLKNRSQIFHLSLEEIRDLLAVFSEQKISFEELPNLPEDILVIPRLHALIKKREIIHKKFKHREPSSLLTSDCEELDVTVEQKEMERIKKEGQKVDSNTLTGLGVSKGIYVGKARVVLSPQDAGLNKGEILVARFTDPGWTPLFTRAHAVVLEVGGYLTHGSVIAREMGLPAVVGVPHVTKLVKTGDILSINGNTGTVKILNNEETLEFLKSKQN